jgi:cytochrome c oxidase subunit 2
MKIRPAAKIVFATVCTCGLGAQLSGMPSAEPRRVEISAKRFSFDPGIVTLKKGETVVLVLKSNDVPHGIRVSELGLELKAPKGGSAEVRFTPDKTGDFVGHCSVFCGAGHGSMTITFHVVN